MQVSFTCRNDRIVGSLYFPTAVAGKDRMPAVVITAAWMTVKEQMPARYAREMAGRGFIALIVHSDAAAIPQGARLFAPRAKAPKEEVWLQGVSQFDFYDRSPAVTPACDAVAAHFRRTLRPPLR